MAIAAFIAVGNQIKSYIILVLLYNYLYWQLFWFFLTFYFVVKDLRITFAYN
jgi:hypothetical protein